MSESQEKPIAQGKSSNGPEKMSKTNQSVIADYVKPASGEDTSRDSNEESASAQSAIADPSVNEFGETIDYSARFESKSETEHADTETRMPTSIGRYQIRSVLGGGAFGRVYLGHDQQLDRQVALKVPQLQVSKQSQQSVEQSFLMEARQLAQLTHPNIVTVFDVGVEEGVCYIVSDYLDGPDLNAWLQGRTPSWQETVRVVASVADALAAAHARGTIHRDVKPANVIMSQRAEGLVPVLVDFGLALSESSAAMPGAQRGQISGTPDYMSPEQASGEGHRIDGRTDIYALGVILYRMLSGQLPFKASSVPELLRIVIEDEPRPPRQFVHGIPRELERICLKAMAKQITDRYTTAGDLATELRSLLRNHEAEIEAAQAVVKAKERPAARNATKILIAEDHELSRFKLKNDLEKWGHEVVAAEDGEQAWKLYQQGGFSIVITDWDMPNMNGLELVQQIRSRESTEYIYVIMLTARTEKHDLVTGMGAGADDFLAKPVHRDELQVRLRAGIRITKLNRELNETNRQMKNSLDAAAQTRRSFLPTSKPEIPGFNFAWEHNACDELGGDMLSIVPLNEKTIGLYVLDVTGDGVPAALLATTLIKVMSPPTDPASLLVERYDDKTEPRILEPVEVAKKLNQRFAATPENKQFFTLAYGVLNLETREFCYTSAGHPPVLHLRSNASPAMLDVSGFPIGMAPETEEFSQESVVLQSGDRLLMYSDGIPDTMNEDGEVFGAARLLESVNKHNQLSLDEMLRSLTGDLGEWRGEATVNDDVSILALEVV